MRRTGVLLLLLAGCSLEPSTSPLASVTFTELPPHSTQSETSMRIEAILDLKATGLQHLGVDSKARMSWIEGKYKRLPADGGTLAVEGDTCRMNITLTQRDYYAAFGFVGHDPVVRIGITTTDGREQRTAGVLQRKP